MISPKRLRSGILIGGSGRRMGGPKQMIKVGDRYLIDLVVDPLGSLGPPVLIGAGPVPKHQRGLERVPDAVGPVGPLAGVLGAVEFDSNSIWLIVACDQPWLTAAAIEWLLAQRTPHTVAVIPHDVRSVQPLPGIYEPGFAPVVDRANRESTISEFANHSRVRSPQIPTVLTAAWASVNRPEDLPAAFKAGE